MKEAKKRIKNATLTSKLDRFPDKDSQETLHSMRRYSKSNDCQNYASAGYKNRGVRKRK